MTTKVVKVLKYVGLFSIVFFTITSCEKEIESIGVNLVNNNNFSTNKFVSEVVTTNVNVDRVPANQVGQYLLGVYRDDEFGKIKASFVTQIGLPASAEEYVYGTNVTLDSVIVNIPYQATRLEENYEGGEPKFSIDSVIGDVNTEFQLNIYELKTFLNVLDPTDPTRNAVYYSDKQFLKGPSALYSGSFKVNPDDTVSYIKRYMPDASVYDTDTIKQEDLGPSIKVPLDEAFIQQVFIDNASGPEFDSFDDFSHYFRGLYIEAEELLSDQSHLISLDISRAKMIIYYSQDEDESDIEDLNNNGVLGEQGVRVKHQYDFPFGGISSSVYTRDYTISHQSGADRLYVQGAAGSLTTLELFTGDDLTQLQNNNWLITEANLIFYVDQNASSNIAPERLFVYNYDDNLQIHDVITEGIGAIGGELERDADGNPYRYKIKITDYISELLKNTDPVDLVKLGVKVFSDTDSPASPFDTKIEQYSWNPKGVVLFGSDLAAGDKRVKLEIFYTELNSN